MSGRQPLDEMLNQQSRAYGAAYGDNQRLQPAADNYTAEGGRAAGAGRESPVQSRKISPGSKESTHRFAGLGVGLAGVCAEHVLSHPCIVLRRQCQVNHDSEWFHLTPFSLVSVIFNLQKHQSVTTLWKGIGSTFMVKGIGVATESAISEFTPLPKEVTRHSTLRKHVEHIILKSLGLIVITPFFAASLVETVQSEIASERPGVFDCLQEGMARLLGWGTKQSTRLLPVWKIVPVVLVHGVLHYVICSLARYTVQVSMRNDMMEAKEHLKVDTTERTIYETYYPELIAAFTGNLLADTLMYPMETVLHRLCLQGTRTIIDNTDGGLGVVPIITRYEGVMDCFYSILSKEGLMGFYKGFGALLLQYGLHMAIVKLTKIVFERLSEDGHIVGMAYAPRPRTYANEAGGANYSDPRFQHGGGAESPAHVRPHFRNPAHNPNRPDVPHRAPHLFQS